MTERSYEIYWSVWGGSSGYGDWGLQCYCCGRRERAVICGESESLYFRSTMETWLRDLGFIGVSIHGVEQQGLSRNWKRLDWAMCKASWLDMFWKQLYVTWLEQVQIITLLLNTEGRGEWLWRAKTIQIWADVDPYAPFFAIVRNIVVLRCQVHQLPLLPWKNKVKEALRRWNKEEAGDIYCRDELLQSRIESLQTKEADCDLTMVEEVSLIAESLCGGRRHV